jgi:beta-glucosidase
LHKTFGSAEHRAVARQAVRESLVLLKHEKKTLPISKQAARIVVAGSKADDIGVQCGGWTIEWQGRGGNVTSGGTTILSAIKSAEATNTQVVFSTDGTGVDGASVVVAVIGERPYAEGMGDRTDLALSREDIELVVNLKKSGVPLVVILISGRPMILGDVLEQADAVIAAWLPGTEGAGVADVLFGDYKPTGKLSFTWPRFVAQIPVHPNGSNYDPVFRLGYGLSY